MPPCRAVPRRAEGVLEGHRYTPQETAGVMTVHDWGVAEVSGAVGPKHGRRRIIVVPSDNSQKSNPLKKTVNIFLPGIQKNRA